MDEPVELDQASVQEILDLGGEELLRDLVTDFRSFADTAMRRIETAAADADCPAVREAAHSIKSTSRTLGATQLHDLLLATESAAAEGDVAAVRELLPRLQGAMSAADAALLVRTGQ